MLGLTPASAPKQMPFSENKWNSDVKYFSNPDNAKVAGLGLPARLEFNPLDVADLQGKPYFIAVDTETFERNGNLICLCNSENESVLYGTVKKSPTLQEYFDYFLSVQTGKENPVFVVYNLKFDAQIILKSLGKDIISLYFGETAIPENGKIPKYTGVFKGIKIKYIPKKMLQLQSATERKKKVVFFDIMQFFAGSGVNKRSDLDSVATKYLGEHKEYDGKYQDKKFPAHIEQDELAKIVKYCRQDCILSKKIIDIWTDDFYKAFGFYPKRYHSLGTIALDYLRTALSSFPTFKYVPYAVHESAYHAYFGGRFEILERGAMENIHHYDIRSAYPYAMSLMPNFASGKWIKIKSLEAFKKYSECVGFYKINVTVNEKRVCPFMVRGRLGLIYCPRGNFITNVTGAELKVALEAYDIKVNSIDGFAFVPENAGKWEFNSLVESMYEKRMNQKNEGQKYIYKVIINSLYGKTAQANPEPRGIFSPVICSYITGMTRATLLDAVKDNKDDVTQFATDAIFSHKALKKLPLSKKLGDFEDSFHPKMIVIMAGIYSYNTTENPIMTTKSRGFELKTINDKGEKVTFDIEKYDLTLENGKYYYEIFNRASIPASKIAMRHKGYSWGQIGQMEIKRKEINLNGDNKRIWKGLLKSINDHNESKAISADMIF